MKTYKSLEKNFIPNMILWRHEVQFSILISLPKTFSPSTIIVPSKFWRVWKKRELSEVWFFDWSFETKTAIFIFDIPAQNSFAKHNKCSFKVPKSLKENRTFKKKFTKNVPLDPQNAVLRNRSKFFSHGSKKVSLQAMSLLIPTSRRELL